MIILGIETSCDETSASIVERKPNDSKVKLLSNIITSSVLFHSKTGGIIPEIAAREQLKYIIPVIEKALKDSGILEKSIDAIAVTIGPGLIGSLLVGVETAKTLSFVWRKPIIPVNHLFGHIYANFIRTNSRLNAIRFPALALIASGGHTDLVLMKNHGKWQWLSGTRDDAAGEALDKIARLLGLPYPGGPIIEEEALGGNPKAFNFPSPMIYSKNLDFSFSGLKTAVFKEIKAVKQFNNETISDLCASVQKAIINVLVKKTMQAAQRYKVESILLGGGVAANKKLRSQIEFEIENLKLKIPLFIPEKWLCTDNAAMIASAASFNFKPMPFQKLNANPELYFD